MIGSGIFTTTGFLGNSLQDPWLVLLVWLLGGGLALLGAISYLELAALLPRAGGEYAFVAAAFGPFWGFLTGWSLFLWGFSAPIALCALTFTKYAAAFVPALGPEGDEALPLVGGSVRIGNLVAALLIVAIAGFHYWRVSSGVRLQNLLTFGKVAAILLLAALALLSGKTRGAGLVEKGAVPPRDWCSCSSPTAAGTPPFISRRRCGNRTATCPAP
jgi:APA family basic amino acid/polyamine antiporter